MDASALDPELERLLDHSDWLRALARKLVGDAATADDLVQETWLAAMKSPPDPARPVRPWLAGVVRRLARMRARGEGRRARRQTEAAREDALPSTSELVENIDTQRRLASVVMELSEPYRTTVMLRYFEGMSSADIARRQGVPSGTVRWRLKRGLDELRERLDDNYSSRNAWCLAFLAMERTHLAIVGTSATTTVGAGTLTAWASAAAVMGALGLGIYTVRNQDVFAMGSSTMLEGIEPGEALSAGGETAVQLEDDSERLVSIGMARLRLVEEDNSPTQGLRAVLVLPGDQALAEVADETGLLSFPTSASEGTLFVAREGSFLHIEDLAFTGEEQEVRLPAGASLVGRVVDTAGAPIEDLALKLDSDRRIWNGNVFPEDVARALGSPRLIRTTTGPDGYFHFRGLAADWSGELGLPPSVSVAGRNRRDQQGDALHVEGPRTDLVIEVERLPLVTGLVAKEGSEPISGADVRVWVDSVDKPLRGRTDKDGRFAIQLDDQATGGLRLEADNAGEGGLSRMDIAAAEMMADFDSGVLDVGTIELVEGQRQGFRATDLDDNPIRGAVARQVGLNTVSSPTDADGRGEIELSEEGELVIEVDAPGYLSSRGDTGSSIADVQLELAAEFTLSVTDDKGQRLPNLMVEVLAEDRLFAEGPAFAPSEIDQVTMAGRPGELQIGEDLGRFFLSEDGDLTLSGVASGVPMQVNVFDSLGQRVATSDVTPLNSAESRSLSLKVVDSLRTLDAVVSDTANQLLVGAMVEIAAEDSHKSATQDDGVARFDQLSTDRVTVTVSMRGFATLVEEDYVLPIPGQQASFILEPGNDVEVLVVDVLGQAVSGGTIHTTGVDGGVQVVGLPLYGSEQVLEDLASGDQVVELHLGGLVFQQTISPADGRLFFTVPLQASLAVDWRLPETEGEAAFRLIAIPATAEGQPLTEVALLEEPEVVEETVLVEEELEADAEVVDVEDIEGEEVVLAVDERIQVVQTVVGSASMMGETDLVLAPGTWIVVLESSIHHPEVGPWTAVGEPLVVTLDLDNPGSIELGVAKE